MSVCLSKQQNNNNIHFIHSFLLILYSILKSGDLHQSKILNSKSKSKPALSFMAVELQTMLLLLLFVSLLLPSSPHASPQNIEVFYPTTTLPPTPSPSPLPIPEAVPGSEPPPAPGGTPPSSSSSGDTNRTIAKAVAATAASTIVIAGVFFFLLRRYVIARRKRDRVGDSSVEGGGGGGGGGPSPTVAAASPNQFARVNGNVKGLIVDENGLDVLYWKQLQEEEGENNNKNGFQKQGLLSPIHDEEQGGGGGSRGKKAESVHEIPLLRGRSSTSQIPPFEDDDSSENMSPLPPPPAHGIALRAVEKRDAPPPHRHSKFSPPPPRNNNTITPPPAATNAAPPPPPPPVPVKNPATPLPPPPPVLVKGPAAPPPPPPPRKAAAGSATSLKPPPPPPAGRDNNNKSSEEGGDNNQVKLKPLHWDKLNKNVEHSMVWDKIHGGSFKVDDNLMEALFGYVATNRKSPTAATSSDSNNESTAANISSSSSQIMVLDARKSQNIAIVLKSLALSRRELLDALNEGQGLDADTLEKLMRIAPTEEEQSQILGFNGDPNRLADAESFLFHVLKAIPSAFTRLNAMQFRSNYDLDILHIKESLQTLELGCKELRSQRLFMKLLEAILKAGNRMNAGTARGNAQAFNLTSLLKLSDVKSTDGKTTLLHFVVEEVVRSEGKKCFISRNRSLSRNNSSSSNTGYDQGISKEDRERDYVTLGLPVVGGLSAEFTNVKKAAAIDFKAFCGTCEALTARLADVKQLVSQCLADGEGGFVKEMKGFIDDAEEEVKEIKEEQTRVLDLLKRTTEYYQAGASKDPFQIFVIVRDFLNMVDQVCVEVARNQQKRKSPTASSSQESRTKMRFPVLPPNFMAGKSSSNSSESDGDS